MANMQKDRLLATLIACNDILPMSRQEQREMREAAKILERRQRIAIRQTTRTILRGDTRIDGLSAAEESALRAMLLNEIAATSCPDDLLTHGAMLFDAVIALMAMGVTKDCALSRNRRRALAAVLDVAQSDAAWGYLATYTAEGIADLAYAAIRKKIRLAA